MYVIESPSYADAASRNVHLSKAKKESSGLLVNVAQPLALGIHDVVDNGLPHDSIRGHFCGELRRIRSAKT